MIILFDTIIALLFAGVPFLIFELKQRKKIVEYNKSNIVVNILIALFFALTYIVYRYFSVPWKAFGVVHVYGLIMPLIMPFALAYFCKGTNRARTVAIVLSAILFLSPLTRPIFLPMNRNMTSIASWDMAIPFNICNVSALIYLIGILTNNKVIKNYMITLGMFGGLINNVQAHNTHVNTFWLYMTWESYFVHYLIIIIPLFMLLTNQIQPNIKKLLINIIWVLPVNILMGFLFNPLWKTNFFFTKPIAFTSFIPQMKNPLIIFGEAVDPLYMLGMSILVAIICAILYGVSHLIYKYVRPKFANANIPNSSPIRKIV